MWHKINFTLLILLEMTKNFLEYSTWFFYSSNASRVITRITPLVSCEGLSLDCSQGNCRWIKTFFIFEKENNKTSRLSCFLYLRSCKRENAPKLMNHEKMFDKSNISSWLRNKPSSSCWKAIHLLASPVCLLKLKHARQIALKEVRTYIQRR